MSIADDVDDDDDKDDEEEVDKFRWCWLNLKVMTLGCMVSR